MIVLGVNWSLEFHSASSFLEAFLILFWGFALNNRRRERQPGRVRTHLSSTQPGMHMHPLRGYWFDKGWAHRWDSEENILLSCVVIPARFLKGILTAQVSGTKEAARLWHEPRTKRTRGLRQRSTWANVSCRGREMISRLGFHVHPLLEGTHGWRQAPEVS